ncbi:hypothetical protein ABI59_04105 [Acidobacteria bacterium Mor1]|nr:hypothetical protein ABI59_04105 [Acidobacteria bacterium Mor1]
MSVRLVLPGSMSPRTTFTVGSALFHVTLLVAVVLAPSLAPRKITDIDAVTVRLTAGIPDPGPKAQAPPVEQDEPQEADPVETPPEPNREEPKDTARIQDDKPEVIKKPEKEETTKTPPPKKTTTPKSEDTKAPADTTPTETPPTQNPSPGGAGEGPVGEGGTGVAADMPGDSEYAWYTDRVSARLKSNWRQPPLAGMRGTMSVTVTFEILRNGSVRFVEIDSPSGIPSLDRSALRAVIESDPLPALPNRWNRPTMPARFVFQWTP